MNLVFICLERIRKICTWQICNNRIVVTTRSITRSGQCDVENHLRSNIIISCTRTSNYLIDFNWFKFVQPKCSNISSWFNTKRIVCRIIIPSSTCRGCIVCFDFWSFCLIPRTSQSSSVNSSRTTDCACNRISYCKSST